MEVILEYLLSVTGAALLCGILQSILGQKGSHVGIFRLVGGIFLALTVLGPLGNIRLQEIRWNVSDVIQDAAAAVEEGKDYSQRAIERHIKQEAEAYILDKAHSYSASISVDVRVAGETPPVPDGCTITGTYSAYARQQLTAIIQEDLGIPKEDQIWITSSSNSGT